jgi:2,5-furandicarboxylate decarboxylase 1
MMVPAMAEIVIEGHILPGVCEPEGPFGETTGYYFAFETQVLEVSAVTHRARPLYQAIIPASAEAETMLGFLSMAEICQHLEELVEGFRGFVFVPGSYCFHGVLSLKKKSKAQARRAALLALNLDARLKQITVVDEDVDINSPQDVLWAVATRCQADTDIVVVPHLPAYIIDPSARNGVSAKVIIDATMPPGEEGRFIRCKPTAAAWAKAVKIWADRR